MKGDREITLVMAGHVDHGKSTLLGRLMHDAGALPQGRIETIRVACEKRGEPFEWAFVLDALRFERAQGITLEASHIVLPLGDRRLRLIDAPGHHELIDRLMTAGEKADAILLVIDATEGLTAEAQHQLLLLQLLGVPRLIVVINKMDGVHYREAAYASIRQSVSAFATSLQLDVIAILPISAREGENILSKSKHMPWCQQLPLLEAIKQVRPDQPHDAPLRLLIQDVMKRGGKRILLGRVESGVLQAGDQLLFLPSGQSAQVQTLEHWPLDMVKQQVAAGENIAITLGTPLLIERGMVGCAASSAPHVSYRFRLRLFWLSEQPLICGDTLLFHAGTASAQGEIIALEHSVSSSAHQVKQGDIVVADVRLRRPLVVDTAPQLLARVVIRREASIVGGGWVLPDGLIDMRLSYLPPKSQHLFPMETTIRTQERTHRNGHHGAVIWLTGLSASGKSTIASALSRRLFDAGYQVVVLDGDDLRSGLCRDLGFSPPERSENIRRASEVAALMAKSGMIVIAAFISPTVQDRQRARAAVQRDFHLVYVNAPLELCESRDIKGLYAKARRGEIQDFTGISAVYEPPLDAEVEIDSARTSVDNAAEQLHRYVEKHCGKP